MIDYLRDQNITFKKTGTLNLMEFQPNIKSQAVYKNGEYIYSQRYINYNIAKGNTAPQSVLFEELFHAVQVKEGQYNQNNNLNVEIEAKMAAYIYMDMNGEYDFFMDEAAKLGSKYDKEKLCWDNTFGRYLSNPTQENYQRMVEFTRQLGYNSDKYYDNPEQHGMSTLLMVMNCDSYQAYIGRIRSLL